MEILVKAKQANNPMFDFLNFNGRLKPFYKHMLQMMKDDNYPAEGGQYMAPRPIAVMPRPPALPPSVRHKFLLISIFTHDSFIVYSRLTPRLLTTYSQLTHHLLIVYSSHWSSFIDSNSGRQIQAIGRLCLHPIDQQNQRCSHWQ